MTRHRHRARDVCHAYYVVLIAGARMAECGSSSSNLSSSLRSSTDIDEELQGSVYPRQAAGSTKI